ncbi:MAG TPA: TetR/AcrR family transcriptional regulator [Gemmatimonadales bacterium]|nr:TetR/AcrR family transcriptional regulator [Gemmatimonadales bacterium]
MSVSAVKRRRTVKPRSPRWRRRKDARPDEILAAALEVFSDGGFAATKLEDVARRAGVTKGTIYLYFESKEALFKALIRESIVPVIAQGEALAQSFTGSARELFEQLVREYWRLVGETALVNIPKLIMAEARNFPQLARFYYEEVVTRGHRLMAGVLQRGISAGEFRPVNVMVAAKLAMSPLMHAVVARKAFAACMPEGFDVASYLDTHIDLYLHGITATDSATRRADKR